MISPTGWKLCYVPKLLLGRTEDQQRKFDLLVPLECLDPAEFIPTLLALYMSTTNAGEEV